MPSSESYDESSVDELSEGEPEQIKCSKCGKAYTSKYHLSRHTRKCTKQKKANLKCSWCNLEFANRGNLVTHATRIHGDYSYKAVVNHNDGSPSCLACNKAFTQPYQLRYHIRKMHFNLIAKVPNAELKKVNQVWFERVLNTNNIMEIKKTGNNTLIMKKLDENTSIKVKDNIPKYIDLSHLYPTDRKKTVLINCELCKKQYVKRDYKKHLEEIHMNIRKHHCNNCNRSFKRSYQYLQHHCNKARKVKGVRQKDTTFKIASVESLSVPLGL